MYWADDCNIPCFRGPCFTDGNGPEVFVQCSTGWIMNGMDGRDDFNHYKDVFGNQGCEMGRPPPSAENEICKKFHAKIKQLSEKLTNDTSTQEADEDYVREVLASPESLLIPTEEIRFAKYFC